jgi:aspartyl-tRNA(Asn)/glutamyl-tRNA(Gln) amidotransferase subunit B
MDEGSMCADVNVSVRKPGGEFGTRCEIKNVNSIRFVGQAIESEARRQIAIIEDGGIIDQETRLFDANKGETRSMRSKEEAHNYRYFPDPDLLPLIFSEEFVEAEKAKLPELPDAKKARFMADFGLSPYDAAILVEEQETAAFYEKVADGRDPKLAANWMITELFGNLNKAGKDLSDSPVDEVKLGGLIDLITDNTISGRIAKDVFAEMFESGKDAPTIVEEKGLRQVTDTGAIESAVDQVIADNPAQVEKARANPKLAGWFVGQVMKATGGKANPKAVNQLVAKKLGL